jgi:hypothetical protein
VNAEGAHGPWALLVLTTYMCGVCLSLLHRPSQVFSHPDPSAFKLTPPFPLHEEYLLVNGIKYAWGTLYNLAAAARAVQRACGLVTAMLLQL